MNITKTELPTRPFTVKKFKLECEGKEYIMVEQQYHNTIESMSYNTGNQELTVVNHSHYQDSPTHEEMIKEWNAEHDPFIPIKHIPLDGGSSIASFRASAKSKIDGYLVIPGHLSEQEKKDMEKKWAEGYRTDPKTGKMVFNKYYAFKPTLLQWIKNLFKKKL